ncbi:MAG TPA: hypothetical protein VGP72_11735 [Planctomycetota bacterium]|jgi:hypothetical protein
MDGRPAATAVTTLYEDWQLRRERILTQGAPTGKGYLEAQIRVLDYLLRRYADSTEARQPARFPQRTDVYLDERAIVVHAHMGCCEVAGIKSEAQAAQRSSRILNRIAALDPQHDLKAPERELIWLAPPADRARPRLGYWKMLRHRAALLSLEEAILFDWRPETIMSRLDIVLQFNSRLPARQIEFLFRQLDDSTLVAPVAADILARCSNESAFEYALLAWQDRLTAHGPDLITARLEALFRTKLSDPDIDTPLREHRCDLLRAQLASASAEVRLRAVCVIEQLGTLHDIGLLLDLLRLPTAVDEDSRERPALLAALHTISGAGTA